MAKKELPEDLQELSRILDDADLLRQINESQKKAYQESESIRNMSKISSETLRKKYAQEKE